MLETLRRQKLKEGQSVVVLAEVVLGTKMCYIASFVKWANDAENIACESIRQMLQERL